VFLTKVLMAAATVAVADVMAVTASLILAGVAAGAAEAEEAAAGAVVSLDAEPLVAVSFLVSSILGNDTVPPPPLPESLPQDVNNEARTNDQVKNLYVFMLTPF